VKNILLAIVALFPIAIAHAQLKQREATTINSTKPVKATEDPDMGGEMVADSSINISVRLKNSKGASVFGGKFKYTTVMIYRKPGSHTLYAAGMNGKLNHLYAIDTKGNKLPATYSAKAGCRACITVEKGLKHYYIIDCDDLPMPEKSKVKLTN
jgi:hypothetical protein